MSKKRVSYLILGLVMMVLGGALFMIGISSVVGDTRITLDGSYYCNGMCDIGYLELETNEYEKLISEEKSFVVFVDQMGCDVADNLRKFTNDYFPPHGVKIYRMMFADVKESSLHEKVKYYPSLVVVSKGKVKVFLRADSDEDAGAFNDYSEFEKWVEKYIFTEI